MFTAARAKHGDQSGTGLLIEFLLVHRRMAHPLLTRPASSC